MPFEKERRRPIPGLKDLGIEIALSEDEDFLKVRETLTRIGLATKPKYLTQVCYILHKQGRYVIVHHQELLRLDGEPGEVTEEMVSVRNTIATLLGDWGLVEIIDIDKAEFPRAALTRIKIISFKDKQAWTLHSPYDIGMNRTAPLAASL